MTIKGKLIKGHGVASGISKTTPYPKGSQEMQFPFFKKMGLDLCHFYLGTININISPFLWKPINSDYYLKNVNRTSQIPPESFMFFDCQLKFDSKTYPGIIYFPGPKTKEQHFQKEDMIEVISIKIPNIENGMRITIEITNGKVELIQF